MNTKELINHIKTYETRTSNQMNNQLKNEIASTDNN